MKIHVLVFPVVFFGALALTHPAHSATIGIKGHNPDQVQGKCEGGTCFGPSDKGVYGCLAGDAAESSAEAKETTTQTPVTPGVPLSMSRTSEPHSPHAKR